MDNVDISFGLDIGQASPNECKAHTNYKGEDIVAYGNTFDEAKGNVIGRCKQLKAKGEVPADETIDLDSP